MLKIKLNADNSFVKLEGFSSPEGFGLWTEGSFAKININFNLLKKHSVKYICFKIISIANYGTSSEKSVMAKFTSNQSEVLSLDQPTWIEHETVYFFEFSVLDLTNDFTLNIFIENPKRPSDYIESSDGRLLGLGFESLVLSKNKFVFDRKCTELVLDNAKIYKNGIYSSDLREYLTTIIQSRDIVANALADVSLARIAYSGHEFFLKCLQVSLKLLDYSDAVIDNFIKATSYILEASHKNKENYDVNPPIPYCSIRRILNVSGFWYSGSSAIYDFLRDRSDIETIDTLGIELQISNDFFDFLNKTDGLNLLGFFIKYLLNLYVPKSNDDCFYKLKNSNILASILNDTGKITIENYSNFVISFVQDLLTSKNILEEREALSHFLFNCASVSSNDLSKKLLLNQSPKARLIKKLGAYPLGTTCIYVHRDPRDQYLSIKNEVELNWKSTDWYPAIDFIKDFNETNAIFEEDKLKHASNYNFIKVSFEDFILNESVRKSLCSNLLLNYDNSENYFSVDYSKTRIGKYKKIVNPKVLVELEIIEQQLGSYLWE